MSAAQGAIQFSMHAGSTPYTETADYLAKYNTRNSSSAYPGTSVATQPVVAQPVAAAPIARTPTPQETLNQQYVPQLNAQMQKDPSNGYADQLKTLMQGQFSTNDPSYQWRFDQGQKAVERSVAAKGMLNSGNAAIELQQYGQGAASQEYGAQFNRTLSAMGASESAFQSSYNRLAELAGMTSGMQANSQNTNYNYSTLAERANNNAAQLGLGYAQLGQKAVNDVGNLAVRRDEMASNASTQAQRTAMLQDQQNYNNRTADNRDAAFKEMIGSRGVGTNGYDAWGNQVGGNFTSVGPTESGATSSIYAGMSGYY